MWDDIERIVRRFKIGWTAVGWFAARAWVIYMACAVTVEIYEFIGRFIWRHKNLLPWLPVVVLALAYGIGWLVVREENKHKSAGVK